MTRQFDVVANPDPIEAAERPYLLVLQSDLVSGLASTIVAPLVPRERMKGAQRLNPLLSVEGRDYWLATHELFAVDQRILHGRVTTVADSRDAIIAALDFVFLGF
jgi:toxin CcdB